MSSEKYEESEGPFSEPWEDSDAIFIVEKKKLHVHTAILSFSSSVFKAMFTPDSFKESATKEVDLKEKEFVDVSNMLLMLYPQHHIKLSHASVKVLDGLLALSKEYMIESIQRAIDDQIMVQIEHLTALNSQNIINKIKIVKLLALAEKYNFIKTINSTIDLLVQYHEFYVLDYSSEQNLSELCISNNISYLSKQDMIVKMTRKHLGKLIPREKDEMLKMLKDIYSMMGYLE